MRFAKRAAIVALALLCLYTAWRVVLNRQVGSNLVAAGQTADDFLAAIRSGDLDKAKSLMSFGYAHKLGRKGLENLPVKYPSLLNVPDPGAIGFESQRLERFASRHFMFPKVAAPKNDRDYLPVVVKMCVGNTGEWRVSDVVVYE